MPDKKPTDKEIIAMVENAYVADLINRLQKENKRLKKENHQFADIGKMYSEVKADAYKEVEEKLDKTTWYRINQKGELVVGANSETDIPLYKAEDVYNLLKELEAT